MSHASSPSVGHLLHELRAGNQAAFGELLPLVYDELHRLAERQRRRWQGDETLDTTALVHEAYLRLADQSAPEWQSRAHFLGVMPPGLAGARMTPIALGGWRAAARG